MSNGNYILDRNNQAVEVDDLFAWGEWFEEASKSGRRFVAKTNYGWCEVSTVFLGVNHAWGHGPPLLFETMIFGMAPIHLTHQAARKRVSE